MKYTKIAYIQELENIIIQKSVLFCRININNLYCFHGIRQIKAGTRQCAAALIPVTLQDILIELICFCNEGVKARFLQTGGSKSKTSCSLSTAGNRNNNSDSGWAQRNLQRIDKNIRA